jgi:hypothetical protein
MVKQEITTQSRLLARLVRDLLATEKFDTIASLTDALKCRCAKLRIRWTNDDITAAYRLIESNRPLPGHEPLRRLKRVEHIERIDEDVKPLTRAEAAELWPRLVARLLREQQGKSA